jgi:redox-sensitive bicupin YhaK (pirin superfamily)
VHFLQIGIVPDRASRPPAHAQQRVDGEAARRGFALLAARDGAEGALPIRQDVSLWLARLEGEEARTLPIRAGRHVWVHVARGAAEVNGHALGEGDGAALTAPEAVTLEGKGPGEVLVFDLA